MEKEDAGTEQPALRAITGPEPVQQEETRATEVTPPAMVEPSPAHQEEDGLVEVGEDPHEAVPQPTQKGGGRPRTAVKYKKVISRKKAGPVPKGGNKERQLSPDKERDKT